MLLVYNFLILVLLQPILTDKILFQNFSYYRSRPLVRVCLSSSFHSIYTFINTNFDFSLFPHAIRKTNESPVVEQKVIELTQTYKLERLITDFEFEKIVLHNYTFYSTEILKKIAEEGIGMAYKFRDESFSYIHRLYKEKIIEHLLLGFENHAKKGVVYFGGIPDNNHLKMPYKGICQMNDNDSKWGCYLSSLIFKGKTIPIDQFAFLNTGIPSIFLSEEYFSIIVNEIYKDYINSGQCILQKDGDKNTIISCMEEIQKSNDELGFVLGDMTVYLKLRNLTSTDDSGWVSIFRKNNLKYFNESKIIFGYDFIHYFNYSILDYESKQIQLYSDVIKIQRKDSNRNIRNIIICNNIILLVVSVLNVLYKLK